MNGPIFGQGRMMIGGPSDSSLIMHRFGFNNGTNSARGKQYAISGQNNLNPLLQSNSNIYDPLIDNVGDDQDNDSAGGRNSGLLDSKLH